MDDSFVDGLICSDVREFCKWEYFVECLVSFLFRISGGESRRCDVC